MTTSSSIVFYNNEIVSAWKDSNLYYVVYSMDRNTGLYITRVVIMQPSSGDVYGPMYYTQPAAWSTTAQIGDSTVKWFSGTDDSSRTLTFSNIVTSADAPLAV